MEPAFQRGDLLFLALPHSHSDSIITGGGGTPVRIGEITVFKLKGKGIPIVHRIIEVHDE